jgi:hypothetical protein
MKSHRLSSRHAAALLLVLATIVLVFGISAERSLAGEATATGPAESAGPMVSESAAEAGEAAEGHSDDEAAAETHNAETTAPHDEATEAGNTMLGIDPESTGAITTAVVISLALAAALWFSGTPGVLIVGAIFALLFAAFDVREVMHQLSESRISLVVIAFVAALLHGSAAMFGGSSLIQRSSSAA